MHEITVPKLNNNDVTYVLVEWLAEDGEELAPDSAVAVVETSKASEDLVVEQGGFLHREAETGKDYGVGTVIARLFPTDEERLRYRRDQESARRAPAGAAEAPPGDVVVTRSAREAAAEHGLDPVRIGAALGRKVLKRGDVEEYVASLAVTAADQHGAAGERVALSAAQRAVGQVVTRSHHAIPSAYTMMKVPVGPALEACRAFTERTGTTIGLPELLVKAIGTLREGFPLFFGSLTEDGSSVTIAEGAHVGVTLDAGKGLYVPVVPDVQDATLARIADVLMDHRFSAMRGAFRESELSGGNIAVSLNNDDDVVLARPIVFTGQTCMLCLSATQEELYRAEDGAIASRSYVNLGLAYDHRVVNGRDSVLFLREVRRFLGDRDTLARLVGAAPAAG